MLQQDAINIVRQYVTNLNNGGILIFKAFIFGSYARNQATENSDIDVMLVSEAFDDYDVKQKGRIWGITSKFDYRIEPYIVGKKRFFFVERTVRKDGGPHWCRV